jgi:hypothetical protein
LPASARLQYLGVEPGDHPPHGVVERGVPSGYVSGGIKVTHLVETLTVDENLEGVLTIKLDQGDPPASLLFPLFAEEGVEPSDYVIGD